MTAVCKETNFCHTAVSAYRYKTGCDTNRATVNSILAQMSIFEMITKFWRWIWKVTIGRSNRKWNNNFKTV
jgi:hypothetical protein